MALYRQSPAVSRLWVIVGASSAISKAFARALALQGQSFLLVGRAQDELVALAGDLVVRGAQAASYLVGDVRDLHVHHDISTAIMSQPLPLGLFVAAGVMPAQDDLLSQTGMLQELVDTNLTAVMQLANGLLPLLLQRPAGCVVLLGSVAGDRGRRKNFLYGATKAGLCAYAQGLSAYLKAHKVPVLLVKPGMIDTSLTWGLKPPPLSLLVPMGTPDEVAAAILRKMEKGGTLYTPRIWRLVMRIIRELPDGIFNKLSF